MTKILTDETMKIAFSSSVSISEEVNASFDKGVLRIAYHGKNRNGSSIDKAVFEDAIPTMFNCPVVCNYMRQENSIGAHDMEVVEDGDGKLKLVNMTTPVGVVPESAKWWWEEIEEESGEKHEYLCTDILVWKRQEAYEKIRDNGITAESMEIRVKSGHKKDGVYVVSSFEFTAFCLLERALPCYESACVELFSMQNFKEQYAAMIAEAKTAQFAVNPSSEGCTYKDDLKGGCGKLNEKEELLQKFGLLAEDIDFKLDDFSVEELSGKFEEIKNKKNFALAEEIRRALDECAAEQKFENCCGYSCRKYWMEDYDNDAMVVYLRDVENHYQVFGFPYVMEGDVAKIDFACGKRKKSVFVDYEDGAPEQDLSGMVDLLTGACKTKKDKEIADLKAAYDEKIAKMEADASAANEELASLRAFKAAADAAEKAALFATFADLEGDEVFEAMKDPSCAMSLAEIEEKCFAIRGRCATKKFSLQDPGVLPVRTPVEHNDPEPSEPYGGLFTKYPPRKI